MGQPPWSNVHGCVTESIGNAGETQGSETSQYLKEKKSTEIPQVVASERGRGQTGRFTVRGCGTSTWQEELIAERFGKSGHRR